MRAAHCIFIVKSDFVLIQVSLETFLSIYAIYIKCEYKCAIFMDSNLIDSCAKTNVKVNVLLKNIHQF